MYEPNEQADGEGDTDGEQAEGGPDEPSDGKSSTSTNDAGGHEEKENAGSSKTDKGMRRIEITNVRIFCTDPDAGKYRLLFQPQASGASVLRVSVIGEVGVEPAPIASYSVDGGKERSSTGEPGLVGPLTLYAGKRASVDVVLENALRCALGVHAYGN